MEILTVTNLIKMYPPNIRAVNGVSFSINAGETLTICGATGSGKTTLFRLLCGLEKPSDGSFVINGKFGALQNDPALFDELTLLENVLLAKNDVNYAKELFKVLSIANSMHTNPKFTGKREQSITSVIRAIITKPELLICDNFMDIELLEKAKELTKCAMLILTDDIAVGENLRLKDGKLV